MAVHSAVPLEGRRIPRAARGLRRDPARHAETPCTRRGHLACAGVSHSGDASRGSRHPVRRDGTSEPPPARRGQVQERSQPANIPVRLRRQRSYARHHGRSVHAGAAARHRRCDGHDAARRPERRQGISKWRRLPRAFPSGASCSTKPASGTSSTAAASPAHDLSPSASPAGRRIESLDQDLAAAREQQQRLQRQLNQQIGQISFEVGAM